MECGAERRGSRWALGHSDDSVLFRSARRLTGRKAYGAEREDTERYVAALREVHGDFAGKSALKMVQ
jgi:hypothetical protein